jgi:hypothetical protein
MLSQTSSRFIRFLTPFTGKSAIGLVVGKKQSNKTLLIDTMLKVNTRDSSNNIVTVYITNRDVICNDLSRCTVPTSINPTCSCK